MNAQLFAPKLALVSALAAWGCESESATVLQGPQGGMPGSTVGEPSSEIGGASGSEGPGCDVCTDAGLGGGSFEPVDRDAASEKRELTGEVTIAHGHTQISSANFSASIPLGTETTITFSVAETKRLVAPGDMLAWTGEAANYFSVEDNQLLDEWANETQLATYLARSIGVLLEGDADRFVPTTGDSFSVADLNEEQKDFFEGLKGLPVRDVRISGDVEVTSASGGQLRGTVFATTTRLEFDDGTTVEILDTRDPIAVNALGDSTAGLETAPTVLRAD